MTTKVPGSLLKDDSVTSAQLGPDSVTETELADNSVTEDAYADDSIPTAAYKPASVDEAALGTGAVTSVKIAANAIIENLYGNVSIPSTAYKLGSIGTTALADDAVTQAKVADAAIGSDQLIDDNVIRSKVGPGAIGTDEIEDFKVTPSKMEKGTQGDLIVATESDGTFTRVNAGASDSVLAIKNGIPTWTENVLPTGVMMDYCGTTSPSGWILANGRTIGSASSGATGRANADTQSLFEFLWTNFADAELAVSGGRGASATADWSANKTIALPDLRGRVSVGRDNMEATSANRLTSAEAAAGGNTMGANGGTQQHTLTTSEIPAHKHFTMTDNGIDEDIDISGSQAWPSATLSIHRRGRGGDRNYVLYADGSRPTLVPTKSPTSAIGSSQAHTNMPPFFVSSKIIKL